MTAEAQWDSTRWRDGSETPRYGSLQQHPQLSALPMPQSGIKDCSSQPWYGTSQDQSQLNAYGGRQTSQTYAAQSSQYTSPGQNRRNGNHESTRFPTTQHHAEYTGIRRGKASHGIDPGDKRASEAPLSLQIPNTTSELFTTPYGYTTPRSGAPIYSSGANSWPHQATSLPSFAALSEQTSRTDEPDEVEIAPMSARLPCNQCAKLEPLIREVAAAVAELDGSVQLLCGSPNARPSHVPNDSAMRTVQWILDRMRYTKHDMQDVTRASAVEPSRPHFSASAHYQNPLKRPAEQWDQDDMPTLKLPRPNAFHPDATMGERRASIDLARDPAQRSAYSPVPSESAPGSAYPRHGSPTSGRLPRGLPSPSSLAFPPSGPASFVPAHAASIGSPGTSYNPAHSIHTVSTSSATSAHLQDLQHQVSLKSLALQTLQSEYATLLQKLQRERIKSQTIEKKTSVADQEVNDLTTKNEEMIEQIKGLEARLQECERKRESERAEAAKEKEQWGRMLDMSGRLQNKSASESQRLAKEKADLLHRLATYEKGGLPQLERHASQPRQTGSGYVSPPGSCDGPGTANRSPSLLASSSDADAVRRENVDLLAKVAMMKSSLDDLRTQYRALEETIEQLTERKNVLRRTMDRAFGKELPSTQNPHLIDAARGDAATPILVVSTAEGQQSTQILTADANVGLSRSSPPTSSASTTTARVDGSTDIFSRENLAQIARAVSPGPAELGFHVQPSTSSPEELIRALGPVPATLPSIRRTYSPYAATSPSGFGDPRHGRRQSQPFVAPLPSPSDLEAGLHQASPFRPLNQRPSSYQQSGLYTAASPHSHHSSPGPNLSNTSSPGSTSTHSPEYRMSVGRDDSSFARRHSQPQLATSPTTAAMPPPPRPFP